LEGGLDAGTGGLGLMFVGGVDAAEDGAGFHGFAGFGELVDADVVVDDGFLGDPAAAEIADGFADDAGIAMGDVAGAGGFQFGDGFCGVVEREFLVEGVQVRALALSISSHLARGAPELREASAFW